MESVGLCTPFENNERIPIITGVIIQYVTPDSLERIPKIKEGYTVLTLFIEYGIKNAKSIRGTIHSLFPGCTIFR